MRVSSFLLALGAALPLALAARPALAGDAEVTSDTAAQFYDVRSPSGETVLQRRRLTTTLGVGAYDLLPHEPHEAGAPLAPELSFRARMRYDADYGASPGETDVTNFGRLVPGYSRGPVDLMYGYVEGRRFLKGWLGFKLGRQYVTDSLGWWSFDGAEVKVTTPYFVAVEAYGGLEQRGGMPFSTSRFERDGVWRGDRGSFDPNLYPSFQPSSIAPAFGAAIESTGVTWLHGRLTYRRVYNTGSSNTSEFASGLYSPVLYDGTRISSERIGYGVDANLATLGGFKGEIAYDLYRAQVTTAYASLDGYVSKRLTLSLDYDFYQPSFDADSIWNFFAGNPTNDFGVRAAWDATDRLAFAANAHARMFQVQTAPFDCTPPACASPNVNQVTPGNAPYFPSSGVSFDEGAALSGRYKYGSATLGARANGNFGSDGDRVGGDVFGEKVWETRYVGTARASVFQWNDKLRPDRDATSAGYVLGAGYRFAPRSQAMVEWEHNVNRLVGQRFRLMLWLTVAVTK